MGMCHQRCHECTQPDLLTYPMHYSDVIMSSTASQFIGVLIVCSTLFGYRSKKISKLNVTGLCEGNPPVATGFPSQRTSDAENVFVWWRHHFEERELCISAASSVFDVEHIGPWKLRLWCYISNFQSDINDRYLEFFLWNRPQVNATGPPTSQHWFQ